MKFYEASSITALFESEFSPLLGKFQIYSKTILEARHSQEDHIWKPGCYVFWTPEEGVIKVGRSLSNARKRALEHIQDNTGGIMKSLEREETNGQLILFNVKLDADKHWAAAAEVFLEKVLEPKIPSKKLG